MQYLADENRCSHMQFSPCGGSGLRLPRVSLGLWHNFGKTGHYETMRAICAAAFNNGITYFDLANNYGPDPGDAEENFGRILKQDLKPYRDELVISTKAGFTMWDGPYGRGGGRKHLLASLDQSLRRMGLDYVDIFYHHCPDEQAPLEESMMALSDAVKSGKALYAGISKGHQSLNRFRKMSNALSTCRLRRRSWSRSTASRLFPEHGKYSVPAIPTRLPQLAVRRVVKDVPAPHYARPLAPRPLALCCGQHPHCPRHQGACPPAPS